MSTVLLATLLTNPEEQLRFGGLIKAWGLALDFKKTNDDEEYRKFKQACFDACEVYTNGYKVATERGLDGDVAIDFALSISAPARMEAFEIGIAALREFTSVH